MGWSDNETDEKNSLDTVAVTEGERLLLDLFSQVPEEKQKMVLDMIRVALNSKE